MAIRPEDEYTEAIAASAAYPGGSFKNVSSPGGTDGTPLEKVWPDDIQGFLQGLYTIAGITPSGVADTVLASDYINGMKWIIGKNVYSADIDYAIGGEAKGSDNLIYRAEAANGPATAAVDPVGDTTGVWTPIDNQAIMNPQLTNYTVLMSDANKVTYLPPGAVADRVYTFDTPAATDDGKVFHFVCAEDFRLSIMAPAGKKIWKSNILGGIEAQDKGCFCSLVYDHTNSLFYPIAMGGGQWMVYGTKFYMPCQQMTIVDIDLLDRTVGDDLTRGNLLTTIRNGAELTEANPNFNKNSLLTNGTDEYMQVTGSTNWDFFGSKSGTKFLAGWIKFVNAAGTAEAIAGQYQDVNNNWLFYRGSSGELRLDYTNGGSLEININSGAVVTAAANWYYAMMLVKDGDVGLYLGTDVVAFEPAAGWNTNTFSSSLFWAQSGNSTFFNPAYWQDLVVFHDNFFNATPDAGLTDTIVVPTKLIEVVSQI